MDSSQTQEYWWEDLLHNMGTVTASNGTKNRNKPNKTHKHQQTYLNYYNSSYK